MVGKTKNFNYNCKNVSNPIGMFTLKWSALKEIAQWVKCLLHKCDDLSLDPQHPGILHAVVLVYVLITGAGFTLCLQILSAAMLRRAYHNPGISNTFSSPLLLSAFRASCRAFTGPPYRPHIGWSQKFSGTIVSYMPTNQYYADNATKSCCQLRMESAPMDHSGNGCADPEEIRF